MRIQWDEAVLLANAPTDTSITSASIPTRGFSAGWVEIFVPHTGDAVGTIALKGGLDASQTTHHDLSLTTSQIFINGANLADNAFTGITAAGGTTPGTLNVAATQVADARIRIPAINFPEYISVVYTRSSGGSSSQFISAKWFGQAGS